MYVCVCMCVCMHVCVCVCMRPWQSRRNSCPPMPALDAGMSAVAVAAAVRINPVSAEDAASGGGLEGTTASGVKYKIIRETTAPGNKIGIVETAKKGDFVILTLKATGADGSVIMDTTQTGQGFAVDLGKGKTILGLEDGVEGMKAGETRILEIPAGPLTEPIKQDVKV